MGRASARRKSLRRWPSWLRRKPGYKHLYALHAHEERVVLAELRRRGSGNTALWATDGRWDAEYLDKTFKRLRNKGLIKRTAHRDRFSRKFTYYPVEHAEEKAS